MVLISERASMSPRRARVAMAAMRSVSALLAADRMAAARACCMVRLMAGTVSAAMARSSAGRAAASREWNTAAAAAARCCGSGERSRTVPRAAFTASRTLLLTPHRPRTRRAGGLAGGRVHDAGVGADVDLPVGADDEVAGLQGGQDVAGARVARTRQRVDRLGDVGEAAGGRIATGRARRAQVRRLRTAAAGSRRGIGAPSEVVCCLFSPEARHVDVAGEQATDVPRLLRRRLLPIRYTLPGR